MQCINFRAFARQLFDSPSQARQAAEILKGILLARSPRLHEIARQMPGQPESAYKRLQRFLDQTDPRLSLARLFQSEAEFVLGDPTEVPRRHAYRTAYVGKVQDETRGFWLLLLATPFRGRAIPFHFVTYSSRILNQRAESRNQYHLRAFAGVKALLGERPLVLDREFSYEWLLANLLAEQVHFVIRLNVGSQPPVLLDPRGKRFDLDIAQSQTVNRRHLRYRGQVEVNLSGIWRTGLSEPLWVMSDLAPERALDIYLARMKIDETFRDLKTLLQLDHLMNQQQDRMEKVVALVLMAFTIGVLVGEEMRDALYGAPVEQPSPHAPIATTTLPPATVHPKRACFSGLFLLLKQPQPLALSIRRQAVHQALVRFTRLIHGHA